MEAANHSARHRSEPPGGPEPPGGSPPLRRGRDQGPARAGGADLAAHHHRDRRLAPRGDDRLLRRGRRRRVPLRDEVDAAVRAGRASACCRSWSARSLIDGRSRWSWPSRSGSARAIYLSEYARPRVRKIDQAGARAARGRADDRLRLLRADLLHAGDPARASSARRRDLQRARGRDRHRLHDRADRRVDRRGRDAGRAAVAARGRVRPRRLEAPGRRCAWSSPPRCRESSRRWCSRCRAPSARRWSS